MAWAKSKEIAHRGSNGKAVVRGTHCENIVNHDLELRILHCGPLSGQAPRCNDEGVAGGKFCRLHISRQALLHITHGFQVMASSSCSWSVKILQRCCKFSITPVKSSHWSNQCQVHLKHGAPELLRYRMQSQGGSDAFR